MKNFFLSRLSLLAAVALVLLLLPLHAADAQRQGPSEAERALYQQIMDHADEESYQECLDCVEQFLKEYPESRYAITVMQMGVTASAGVDARSRKVIQFAEQYMEAYKAQVRASYAEVMAYAGAAGLLAEADSHLDKAAEYITRALEVMPENMGRSDARIRSIVYSTAAEVADARSNPGKAVDHYRKALEFTPDDSYLAAGLGQALIATGALEEAERLIAAAVLESPDLEPVVEAREALVKARTSSPGEAKSYLEDLFGDAAHTMLMEAEDATATSLQLARAFAGMGIYLERALGYAEMAVAAAGPDAGINEYKEARTVLATVLGAMGEYDTAYGYLAQIKRLASPYDQDLHLAHGMTLQAMGREKEAIDAYLAGVVLFDNPAIAEHLEPLWEKVYGDTRDLAETKAEMAQELENWHPDGHFEVPADWSGRVVLAELFTGSECPPCVASDLAYDGILEYYPSSVVAVLEYHEHIPGPDPMTNPDSEARMAYYTRDVVQGTPTSIVNGIDSSVGGGGAAAAGSRFSGYGWSIEKAMKAAPAVAIGMEAHLDGNALSMSASVSITDAEAVSGQDLRLRVALAERVVHHLGGNGVAEHKMVVRGFLGGPDGFPVDATEGGAFAASMDLARTEAELLAYLNKWEADNQSRFRGSDGFTAKRHEIDRSGLTLVAFVQDEASKEVLQARVVELR
jgi:tetratricopeptide (TPR) repeat protein